MRNIILFLTLAMSWVLSYATEFKFGQICITPYPSQQQDVSTSVNDILVTKMSQILMNNGLAADMSERFIMIPYVIINNVGTTATIPFKTSVSASITFAIGDGVAGTRFSYYTQTVTGVGDNPNSALISAARKIHTTGDEIGNFVKTGTNGITEYYNNNAPSLLRQAKALMASADYEQAIILLAPIPSFCNCFNESQTMLESCGAKIIDRDNEKYLINAQSAWASNPNVSGAEEAKTFISHIVNPTIEIKRKVDLLNRNIQNTLTVREVREHELTMLQISTQTDIQKAEIQASASVASAFFSSIPKLVISALKWF